MSATMKDIAARSGVSIFTVSKYVNGGHVKKENAEKIEAAVAELGYKVNTTARALKTSRSMTIGIIMEELTNSFYSGVMSVVDNYFLESGYSSIITETKGRSEES
ncbi:MAG: LacI family DNA-binding transcriptional regulator, partial [Clostridia bacterium]|nr:LacI family DNA-binding transcriptional regulator [Clostridia bacterium]